MIRTSTGIGLAALLLSLVVHYFGFALTFPDGSPRDTGDPIVDQIAVGEAFEDLADAPADPVEPERAEVPDPPAETPPEPERAEAPTSEALVASSNPERVASPDRGTVRAAVPTTASGPVEPEQGDVPDPEIADRSGGTETAVSDARLAPLVGPETANTALGSPDGVTVASPPVAAPVAKPADTAPADASPAAPIAEAPQPDILAALTPEAASPEFPLPPDANEEEGNESTLTGGGISSSVRPQLRPDVQSAQPRGTAAGRADQSGGLPPRTNAIESPLAAYQRDGTNLFAGRRGGARSGGAGFGGALGPGNSDVTNYAGEVLMHLNRVPPVAVSARGWSRVVFRIEPDGSLAFVDIIDSSGASDVDRAAKAHVRRGAPFPLPPGGKSRMLNFIYQIQ